jgi:hypothetical protein
MDPHCFGNLNQHPNLDGSALFLNLDPHPDLHSHKIKIRIGIRNYMKVISWIRDRIRINFQMIKSSPREVVLWIRIRIRRKSRVVDQHPEPNVSASGFGWISIFLELGSASGFAFV